METFYHKSVHVLPEDPFVNVYKQNMLEAINDNIASQRIKKALDRNKTESGGLANVTMIKVNSRVMLMVNVDLSDRLANAQLDTVEHISKHFNGQVTKIYIKFDNAVAGQKKINKDTFAKRLCWVPIE